MARILLLAHGAKRLRQLEELLAADTHELATPNSVGEAAELWLDFDPEAVVLELPAPSLTLHRLERRLGGHAISWSRRPVLVLGEAGDPDVVDDSRLLVRLPLPVADETLLGHVRGLARLHALLEEPLDESNEETLSIPPAVREALAEQLVHLADYRDASKPGHGSRVAEVAGRIARELGLDEPERTEIERAGRWHDLGKLAISAEVLRQPGRLDEHALETIREHPRRGARLVRALLGDEAASHAVLGHHERVDGQGYEGLAGDAIPLPARILAAAEAWDSLTHEQTYRPAFTPVDALAMMREEVGAAWDADVVGALARTAR